MSDACEESQSRIADAHPCPMCDYLLVGLPETHRCLECGFLFDPHARVIELGSTSRFKRSLALGVILLALLLSTRGGDWSSDDFVFMAIIAGAMFFTFIRMAFVDHLRRLLLNREGVQFIRGQHCRIVIDWRHVDRVKSSLLLGKLRISDCNNQSVYRCPLHELGGWRTGRRCARAINEALQVYRDS